MAAIRHRHRPVSRSMWRDDVRGAAAGVLFGDRCARARLGGAGSALRRRQRAAGVRRHAHDAVAFVLATERTEEVRHGATENTENFIACLNEEDMPNEFSAFSAPPWLLFFSSWPFFFAANIRGGPPRRRPCRGACGTAPRSRSPPAGT